MEKRSAVDNSRSISRVAGGSGAVLIDWPMLSDAEAISRTKFEVPERFLVAFPESRTFEESADNRVIGGKS